LTGEFFVFYASAMLNYQRLAAVKKKYDPAGLSFVHRGVGSEGWSVDGFTHHQL